MSIDSIVFMVILICIIIFFICYSLSLKESYQSQIYNVIHLKDNQKRRLKLEQRFIDKKLHYFEAIDTRNDLWKLYSFYLENEQIQELIEYNLYQTRKSHKNLLPGAVGCFLSHIFLYKQLLSTAPSSFIIIEDDVVPNHSFFRKSSFLQQNMPQNIDIILLDYIALHRLEHKIEYKGLQFVRIHQFFLLTAYIISKQGIINILNAFKKDNYKIKVQYDFYLSQLIQRGILTVIGINPKLCQQDQQGKSQIQGGYILENSNYSL